MTESFLGPRAASDGLGWFWIVPDGPGLPRTTLTDLRWYWSAPASPDGTGRPRSTPEPFRTYRGPKKFPLWIPKVFIFFPKFFPTFF